MGKKGSNKASSKAAPPAPAASSSTSTGKSQQQQEEDEAAELKRQWAEKAASNQVKAKQAQAEAVRQNERNKEWEKQQAAKQRDQAREDQKWQKAVENAKARAKKESVLEAEDWGETWWLDLGNKNWKEVADQFFCKWCEKCLNEGNLEAHLDSIGHKKKLAWNQPTPSGAASASRPAAASTAGGPAPKAAAAPAASAGWGTSGALEEWQEMTAVGVRCIPCGKVIDESHLAKDDHKNRLAAWFDSERARKYGRPAPAEPYLAWVPWEPNDPDGERCLKCLLCNKWVQDEGSHIGTFQAPTGSKEHAKNLRNADVNGAWYKENVVALRRKWHPEAANAAPTTRTAPSTRTAAPSSAGPTPAPWGQPQPQATPAPWGPPQPQATPAPWAPQAAPTPAAARWGKASQVAAPPAAAPSGEPPAKAPPAKAPPAKAAPAPTPPATAAPVDLPPGWEVTTDQSSGKPYYFNRTEALSSWEPPELPRSSPPPPPPASPPRASEVVDV